MVKQKIANLIHNACDACKTAGIIPPEQAINPIIEIPREEEHGDYSTNIAFLLAPKMKRAPLDIAEKLIEHMDFRDLCERVETAGKGFINFYVKDDIWRDALSRIVEDGLDAIMPDVGRGRKAILEFVSANPTGPLHIGHGRGAAVGDVLARVLKKAGFRVTTEYYVNDAGKQINTLGESTYGRWLQLNGEPVEYEKHYYQGDYVTELARELIETNAPVPEGREEAIQYMALFSSGKVMDGIKDDVSSFGVHFDNFYNESSLYEKGAVDAALKDLRERGFVYEKDDALWFRTSEFENDEDRVLIKSDGEKTYFASDIAYHRDKYERGYDLIVDIWGSDHHGYIPRMRASIAALGKEKESLKVMLIQFVTLLKDGKPVGMSTRSGQFTTLREVLEEVGKDAARFFFLMRKSDAHLEFDLDLAKKTSNENPVYYVQYAHARIASIFRNAEEEGIRRPLHAVDISLLKEKEEITLVKDILHYADVIEGSAKSLEPHRVTFYLMETVARFHSYYNKIRILGNEKPLTLARLMLIDVLQTVIRDGLEIIGVSAPERM